MARRSDKADLSTNAKVEKAVEKLYTRQTCRLATVLVHIALVIMLLIGVIATAIFKTEVNEMWEQLESLKKQFNRHADSGGEF